METMYKSNQIFLKSQKWHICILECHLQFLLTISQRLYKTTNLQILTAMLLFTIHISLQEYFLHSGIHNFLFVLFSYLPGAKKHMWIDCTQTILLLKMPQLHAMNVIKALMGNKWGKVGVDDWHTKVLLCFYVSQSMMCYQQRMSPYNLYTMYIKGGYWSTTNYRTKNSHLPTTEWIPNIWQTWQNVSLQLITT